MVKKSQESLIIVIFSVSQKPITGQRWTSRRQVDNNGLAPPTIKKNSKSLNPGEIIGSNHPCVLAFWHHHHYFFFEQTAAEQQLLGFFQDSTTSRCRVAESCASPADAENLLLILLLKYAMIRLFLQKQLI
jgi:hypothetical protein